MILVSDDYGLVGDGTTDNTVAFENWITAANNAIGAISGNKRVRMVLTPGDYCTTGSHKFPGEADVEFQAATIIRNGSDASSPCFIHGRKTGTTSGRLTGICVDSRVTVNQFYHPEYVGVRLLNKIGAVHDIPFVRGFSKGIQGQADGFAFAYNQIDVGQIVVCHTAIDLNCATADSAFPSENKINGGNIQGTSSFVGFGSCFGLTLTRDYETMGYGGHSGNFWYKPCFQLGMISNTGTVHDEWSASQALTAGRRYFTPKIGGEWLCRIAGTSGAVEPTIIPEVIDKIDVALLAGSTQITMPSTTGIVAGMHMRGSNPANAFPLDTYVVSVDSGTQVTMTHAAGRSSSNYHASFVAPTIDGAATLIYLGPFRRSPVWLRGCGAANGVYDARWEQGVGEAVIVSGAHLFPQSVGAVLGGLVATLHSRTQPAVKVCNFPVWASRAYAVGEAVRPAGLASEYWECITAGASGASEPVPPNTTPGSTFSDGAVRWLVRSVPDTDARGDWGEYVGGAGALTNNAWDISVGRPFDPVTSTAKLDNLHLRAIGSATGWLVRGAVRCTFGGAMTSSFAPTELALSREALLLKSLPGAALGAILRTDKIKSISFRKHFSPYGRARAWMIPLDASYKKITTQLASQKYHRRIQSVCVVGAGLIYNEPSDGPVEEFTALIHEEVDNLFVGIAFGQSTAPIALAGIEIAEKPHRARASPQTHSVELFTLLGNDQGPRLSLGTPIAGFFLAVGEYIHNASFSAGASPKGWLVKTAGVLAPAWAPGRSYVIGELVMSGGNIYGANGAFTSGTAAPSGIGSNILDADAPVILLGDVATWDYVAPVAVLTVDEDTNAVFVAGNTSATATPNCANGLTQVWTMTSNSVAVEMPTAPPQIGQVLTLIFVQDATGNRAIVWNAAYRNPPPWAAGSANQRAMAEFKYDGSRWQFTGGSTAFA